MPSGTAAEPEWSEAQGTQAAKRHGVADSLVNAFNATGTLIQANDWKFTLLADGVTSPPAVNDRILTRTGRWTVIVSVSTDPAGAVYTVQAR